MQNYIQPASKKLLVVEDDADIRTMLGYLVMKNGYLLEEAVDAEEAQELIASDKPDLIILDWMLPGTSGIEYARILKGNSSTRDIPIIMLTAKASESDKVSALDSGVDDYITKPFSNKEFLARIRAAMRRSAGRDDSQKIELNGLTIDLKSHRVLAGNQEVDLDPTEFRLLHFFVTHPDKAYSREQITQQIWGQSGSVDAQTVNVYIRRLRKILTPYGFDKYLQTVRHLGYRFSAK